MLGREKKREQEETVDVMLKHIKPSTVRPDFGKSSQNVSTNVTNELDSKMFAIATLSVVFNEFRVEGGLPQFILLNFHKLLEFELLL